MSSRTHKLRIVFLFPIVPFVLESLLRVVAIGRVSPFLDWLAAPTLGLSLALSSLLMRRELDNNPIPLADAEQEVQHASHSEEFGIYALTSSVLFAGYVFFDSFGKRHLSEGTAPLDVVPDCIIFFSCMCVLYFWSVLRASSILSTMSTNVK